MNTKIGTSFGFALLLAIAAFATMFAMGMLTPKPASAAVGSIDVTITPATAYSNGAYTILVTGTGTAGLTAIPVGGTITITFGSKFTVPSTIATTDIKMKATVVSGGGTAGRLNDVSAVTISGRAVTITVPDLDDTNATGDQGVGAHGGLGVGSAITITFTQAAGILNPKKYQAANAGTTGTLTVKTSTDAVATANTQTEITAFSKFTPSTAARGTTATVTGGGFNATCDDCKIRLNPQNAVAPTTGAGGVAFNGSGTIDADGVFAGTIELGAGTKAGGYVWITDKNGYSKVSTTAFVQKPGATPRSTTSKPGSTVTVDLVDFTADATLAYDGVLVAGTALATYLPRVHWCRGGALHR